MKRTNHLLISACILFTFTLLITDCAQAPPSIDPEPQHPELLFHPETTYQTMTGFGAGLNTNYYINLISNPSDWARAYDLLYGPGYNGTRLNIVRLVVSTTAKELPSTSPLYAQGLRYDWGADDVTLSMWSAIQPVLNRIKPIIYAVPFSPPVSWKIATAQNPYNPNCNINLDARLCGGELDPDHYEDYAGYLTDFVDYYHKILHVDIDVLSIQNEPGISASWPSCIWTGEQLRAFLIILTPMLRARGLNAKMMLSEGTSWSGAAAHLAPTVLNDDSRKLLDIMATHSYLNPQDPGRALFAAAWEQYKLPVWMSEMSLMNMQPPENDDPTMKAALSIAEYMHRDIYAGRASVWIYCFAIFTYTFQGSMGVLSPADQPGREGQLIVPKRLWAMANYSQFVKPGWKVMKVDGSLGGISLNETNTTGFINPTGDGYVIVAINNTDGSRKVTYRFGNRWFIGGRITSYCTSEQHDLTPNVVSLTRTLNSFTAVLPPKSVTTFKGGIIKVQILPYSGNVIMHPQTEDD